MERAKLIVKNFGPLKDINIEVREMVTFIGAQASGKSTLAKLLSIFEDESFRREDNISFEDELKKYNIFSYLNKETFIEYTNDQISQLTTTPFRLNYSQEKFEKRTDSNIIEKYNKVRTKNSFNSNLPIIDKFKKLIKGYLILCNGLDINFESKVLNLFPNDLQKSKFKKLSFEEKNEKLSEKHIDEFLEILEKENF